MEVQIQPSKLNSINPILILKYEQTDILSYRLASLLQTCKVQIYPIFKEKPRKLKVLFKTFKNLWTKVAVKKIIKIAEYKVK